MISIQNKRHPPSVAQMSARRELDRTSLSERLVASTGRLSLFEGSADVSSVLTRSSCILKPHGPASAVGPLRWRVKSANESTHIPSRLVAIHWQVLT